MGRLQEGSVKSLQFEVWGYVKIKNREGHSHTPRVAWRYKKSALNFTLFVKLLITFEDSSRIAEQLSMKQNK